MALQDLLEMAKQAEEGEADQDETKEASEEEIKEAEAAGEIIGMAFVDEINKMAQAAAKEDMGDEYNEGEGADSSTSPDSAQGTVEKLKKKIENQQQAQRSNNPDNDAGADTAENDEDTAPDYPNQPDKNKDQSLSKASADKIAEALLERLDGNE